jgi:hypothetical protein
MKEQTMRTTAELVAYSKTLANRATNKLKTDDVLSAATYLESTIMSAVGGRQQAQAEVLNTDNGLFNFTNLVLGLVPSEIAELYRKLVKEDIEYAEKQRIEQEARDAENRNRERQAAEYRKANPDKFIYLAIFKDDCEDRYCSEPIIFIGRTDTDVYKQLAEWVQGMKEEDKEGHGAEEDTEEEDTEEEDTKEEIVLPEDIYELTDLYSLVYEGWERI